ncbi:hypothetical protein [Streptomyces aureus]|uniref:hypothetical protein n=1 Tax=Streptomyces aureus TaxID=193461 RepID=UPI0033CD6338
MEAGGGGTFAFAESRTAYDEADRADPTILEPTTTLAPRSRRDLWTVLEQPVADGTTVLPATQYPEEACHAGQNLALKDNDIGRHTWEAFIAERSAA